MKNAGFKIFLVLVCCFALCALSFEIVSAYELLQPLPEGAGEIVETGLSDYLTWLYRFALGAAIFLAVLKIVIGGIYIIVGGASETAHSKGREMIEMALWGLLLAVSAWLLLNTINPDFVTGKFGIPPATIESKLPPLPTMGGEWVTKLADDTKTREYLKSYYIFVNKGPCPNSYNDTNCTML
ncbi:hypothetical protein KKG15_03165, partial [Patescibacteria group bacterium]|nr:hypothetical protein [Patescibacteria group bacterium]